MSTKHSNPPPLLPLTRRQQNHPFLALHAFCLSLFLSRSFNLFTMHLPPLDTAVYPIVTMNHGRHISRISRAPSTESLSSASSASSPIPSPTTDFPPIQKTIQSVFHSKSTTIQRLDRLHSRLHQVYLVTLTSGDTLILTYPPHASTRVLRHEKHSLETTFRALHHLHSRLPSPLPIPSIQYYTPHAVLLTSHLPGVPLTTVLPSLSTPEKSAIDRTLGVYTRAIATLTAPQFGLAHAVSARKAHASWRAAFHALLESALRDCEDMLVTLPYESLRACVGRHLGALDEVHTPRMVVMHLCEPDNVLVDARTKEVTGLVGFSNVVWGDALLGGGLAGGSEAFWEGYGEGGEDGKGKRVRALM